MCNLSQGLIEQGKNEIILEALQRHSCEEVAIFLNKSVEDIKKIETRYKSKDGL